MLKNGNMKRSIFVNVLASAMVCGAAACCMLTACASQPAGDAARAVASQDPAETTYRPTVNLADTDYPDLTYAAESAVDAVVYVKVTIQSNVDYSQMDPFLRYFFGFGDQMPRQREQSGSGSGVIIRPDGYIVTANHVIANATKVEVTLNDNKTYEAQIIGSDSATDVALLKIDATGLPSIPMADSDNLRLGEWVLAIGSPLGEELRGTITAGIVSAKGRSNLSQNDGQFRIESFIQTDAAVNPGNSGGALVNKKGELVGINTAIISQTGTYTGYSFAVPTNIVKKVVGDLIDFGSVKRARLGVTMGTVNDKIAKDLKLSETKGVYIDEVSKGSAADKGGLKHEDVIIAMDNTPINTASELQAKVNSFHPGDKAVIHFIREGKKMETEVTFQGEMQETGTVDEDGTTAFYGAKLKAADKETLRRLGIKGGVEIVEAGNGKMFQAGASDGFIIEYVNDEPVAKPEDVVNIAKKSKRAIFIEGVTANGKSSYFGFGKE